MSNAERATWPQRILRAEHEAHAKAWREAETEAARKRIFDAHGIRWSELLCLDYWDPTKYALINAMHNLFLGTLHHHCMEVWDLANIGVRAASAKDAVTHTPQQQQEQLDRIIKFMKVASHKGSHKGLKCIRRDYLMAMAQLNNVPLPTAEPSRAELAEALLNWVCVWVHLCLVELL